MKIKVYTDGASENVTTKVGGWGWYIQIQGKKKTHQNFGWAHNTTNNRMEMTAALKSLKFIQKNYPDSSVIIISDSKYLIDGMNVWSPNWKKWTGNKAENHLNRDLWKKMWELDDKLNVKWEWVRGHNGNEGNEIADKLATKGKAIATSKLKK